MLVWLVLLQPTVYPAAWHQQQEAAIVWRLPRDGGGVLGMRTDGRAVFVGDKVDKHHTGTPEG